MNPIIGTAHYGLVDRVLGLCAVSTKFFHVFMVPLIPLRTYLLDARGGPQVPIPMSLKSVLITYVRAWFSLQAAVFYASPIATLVFLFLIPKPELEQLYAVLIAAFILSGILTFLAVGSRRWPGKVAFMVLAAGTVAYLVWDLLRPVVPGKEEDILRVQSYAITAGAACLVSILLLRYCEKASLKRACELGSYIHMTPEEVQYRYNMYPYYRKALDTLIRDGDFKIP